jgi:hypothetical protein
MYDAARLAISLRTAIAAKGWNPTDWGKALLGRLESAMRIQVEDDGQRAMRAAIVSVQLSDMVVHVRGEIADRLMASHVLDDALSPAAPVAVCDDAVHAFPARRAA